LLAVDEEELVPVAALIVSEEGEEFSLEPLLIAWCTGTDCSQPIVSEVIFSRF
jgi:hypothetical protein